MKNDEPVWSQDNIINITAASHKKGTGINSILSLLQDLLSFKEKLCSTIEAQDISENKSKLENFSERLDEMYTSLLDMAKGGIKGVREPVQDREESDTPFMMNDNTIQKLP